MGKKQNREIGRDSESGMQKFEQLRKKSSLLGKSEKEENKQIYMESTTTLRNLLEKPPKIHGI